jgi:hypothetical protein
VVLYVNSSISGSNLLNLRSFEWYEEAPIDSTQNPKYHEILRMLNHINLRKLSLSLNTIPAPELIFPRFGRLHNLKLEFRSVHRVYYSLAWDMFVQNVLTTPLPPLRLIVISVALIGNDILTKPKDSTTVKSYALSMFMQRLIAFEQRTAWKARNEDEDSKKSLALYMK